jgi:N-ethylmaleimide reductase
MVGTVVDNNYDPRWDAIVKQLRADFPGVLMLAGGYTRESAEQALASGRADIIAFGRPFIANPDLPARLQLGAALNSGDGNSFFGGDAGGYIDYPAMA